MFPREAICWVKRGRKANGVDFVLASGGALRAPREGRGGSLVVVTLNGDRLVVRKTF